MQVRLSAGVPAGRVPEAVPEVLRQLDEKCGSQGINWDNVAGVGDLLRRYMSGPVKPSVVLSNVIGMRWLLIQEGADADVIAEFNRQVGETAKWYHQYFEHDPDA